MSCAELAKCAYYAGQPRFDIRLSIFARRMSKHMQLSCQFMFQGIQPVKLSTLTDVANLAGVSYATADRVVNNRGRVSAKSTDKVQHAVDALRYVRNVAAANLSQGRKYRFIFVLPEGQNAFFQNIRDILRGHNSPAQDVEIQNVSAFDAEGLSRHLMGMAAEQRDGIAVVGVNADALIHPLEAFRAAGTPVVAFISDLPVAHRAACIGIDNVAAGRTAARLLGLAHGGQEGLVQVIVGNMAATDHQDRLAGFHALLETDFPKLKMLPVVQSSDYGGRVEAHVQQAIRDIPDITAIYNAGAGNSGLSRAVQKLSCRPLIVAHELTAHARVALETGLFDYIIDQRPEAEIEAALNLMRALADDVPPPHTSSILPTIYVRDNLPPHSQQGCDHP
jgi:LacI family transcriptional regulator